MLRKQAWLTHREALSIELKQAREEGRLTPELESQWEAVQALTDSEEQEKRSGLLYDAVQAQPVAKEYPYVEPSDLSEILAACTAEEDIPPQAWSQEALFDKIYGGWLARTAGCLLGQPIEGWKSPRIQGLLKDTGNAPVKHYISSDIGEALRAQYEVSDEGAAYGNTKKSWINNIDHAPEDDDTNYTIVGLLAMERYGKDFTPDDMGELWLTALPILHTCTAERVAYKNLVNLHYPPDSASYRNPYREWIGAQIRADAFGYAAPGNPRLAVRMCYSDAAVSHVKNGIYGEMWVGAMLALAFVETDLRKLVGRSLNWIPSRSRLHAALSVVLEDYDKGMSQEAALEKLSRTYDEYDAHDWCHTISNACIVALALLYGQGDLTQTLGISIWPGFDTDCNAATAGSVLGVILGAQGLPEQWIAPLNDKIRSGVDGFGLVTLSGLAQRTTDLAMGFLEKNQA